MRVYIAGPMTGYYDYNRHAFDDGVRLVEKQGWAPVNPYGLDATHEGNCPKGTKYDHGNQCHPWECWIRAALRLMLTCDAVLMLPNWQYSRGATIEHDVAEQVGMTILYEGVT